MYETCVACGEPVDYCQGGHGAPCESCNGYERGHEADCPEAKVKG